VIIAVDFDNVIYDHDGKWRNGELTRGPVPGAREALAGLATAGHTIIINSTRNWHKRHRERMAAWMDERGIPYHEIASHKPNADLYIDDKALRFETWGRVLAELAPRPTPRLRLAAVGVRRPGNVGRLLRSAGEFGAEMTYLLDCAEPSGQFRAAYQAVESFDDALLDCSPLDLTPVAFHPRGKSAVLSLPPRALLVFGGETDGLPGEILEKCAHTVRIPGEETYSCLTVEAAAAIACCRWYEQWRLP